MIKCEKCGTEINENEVYETEGKKLCEDCSMLVNSYSSPKKSCGQ